MGTALAKRLVQSRFESPVQVAILNLLVAASYLQEQNERLLAEHNLSPAQYNVLRILKGVHPEGHPRCEIARRMIERAPDLTRMIDGLERRGLVERAPSDHDRRHSITRITRRGLDLIQRTAPATAAIHGLLARRLTRGDLAELSRLCEKLYASA